MYVLFLPLWTHWVAKHSSFFSVYKVWRNAVQHVHRLQPWLRPPAQSSLTKSHLKLTFRIDCTIAKLSRAPIMAAVPILWREKTHFSLPALLCHRNQQHMEQRQHVNCECKSICNLVCLQGWIMWPQPKRRTTSTILPVSSHLNVFFCALYFLAWLTIY